MNARQNALFRDVCKPPEQAQLFVLVYIYIPVLGYFNLRPSQSSHRN